MSNTTFCLQRFKEAIYEAIRISYYSLRAAG
jgi:hypothetical protein